ncbi:MAG: hypothetical protein WAM88_13485 [Nitrososphaeraceae archaeon]
MGSRIPNPIRNRVAQQWVMGVSRDIIAKDNQISTGTVSTIIHGFKDDGFIFDPLREAALLLKKEGLDITLLPSSVRLRRRLEERGLIEMQIDSLIEAIDVHCFRRGIAVEQFVDTIQEISALLHSLEIPVNELPQFIAKEKEQIEILKQVSRDTKSKTRKFLQSVDVTLDILVEYERDKGKLQNYEMMEKKVNDIQQLLNYYNSPGRVFLNISKVQLNSINTFFINSVTEDGLTKMLQYMCNNPIRFIDTFSSLQKQSLGISSDALDNESCTQNEN